MKLSEIMENGTLLDNQPYSVTEGVLTNRRLDPVFLNTGNEPATWDFLHWVSRDVEKELRDNIKNSLILFNDANYEHNTGDSFIGLTGTDARNFTLNTGNLIGFVKRDNYSLKIGSRFGDGFLRYIIADADGFLELKDMGGESELNDYKWLLAYLWNIKLKRAFRLGLPKAYITRNDRLSCVRGTIDAIDYFQNKMLGKYLCSYREHSYDSPATSLFIKAYESIKDYSFCQRTRSIYNALLVANQGVKRSRQEIMRTPHFTNSFYRDYNILIDLSKRLLNQQGASFDPFHESSAFFFDISMLFEYFIRKLIKRDGVRLSDKSRQEYTIPTGTRRFKLKPDLVFEGDGGLYVFDVKYKYFDFKYGVKREDLFQLHTYIGQCGNGTAIKGCGFIYPISEDRMSESEGLITNVIQQHGRKIPFHVLFLKIPKSSDHNFTSLMREQCQTFMSNIHSIMQTG